MYSVCSREAAGLLLGVNDVVSYRAGCVPERWIRVPEVVVRAYIGYTYSLCLPLQQE